MRRRMGWARLGFCLLAGCGSARSAVGGEASLQRALRAASVIDLSHSYDTDTIYWPTDTEGFRLEVLAAGPSEGGHFYAANRFCTAEHGGTHMDAPHHFAEHGVTAERVPLSRLIGPAAVLDIAAAATANPDTLLLAQHVEAFEHAHGKIEPGTIVVVRTGWAERWPDKKRYMGDDRPGKVDDLHFPGVSREAAEALAARRVAAVGIDTASIDYGPSREFPAHQVLGGANIPIFENLAEGVEALPPRGAWIVALPMKIAGGSGGPLRAVALLSAQN